MSKYWKLFKYTARKLSVYEAPIIIDKQPALNRHVDSFIDPLKLFAGSNHNRQTFVAVPTRNDTSVDGNLNVNAAPCRYFLRWRRLKFVMYISVYWCIEIQDKNFPYCIILTFS